MATKPKPEITQEQERRCWELRLRGYNQQRIADDLGIDQATVSRMLSRMRARLAKTFEGKAAEMRAEQTELLQEIMGLALGAWEESRGDAEKILTRRTRGRASVARKITTGEDDLTINEPIVIELPDEEIEEHTIEPQAGNPAYLSKALEALGDLRDLWGLEAPKKADITSNGESVKWYGNIDPEKI